MGFRLGKEKVRTRWGKSTDFEKKILYFYIKTFWIKVEKVRNICQCGWKMDV